MRRLVLGAAVLAVVGGSAGSAGAVPIVFSYSDGTNAAAGTLTASDLGGGQYLATAGTLTITGPAAGSFSIVPGGPAVFGIPGFNVDNVIIPAANPILNVWGLALVSGTTYLNIWGNGPGNYSFWTYDTGVANYVVVYDGPAVATASVVPEPSTVLLLGAGLTGLAGAMRRRQPRA